MGRERKYYPNQQYVHIPNTLIEDIKIPCRTKYLYIVLKSLSVNGKLLNVTGYNLLQATKWKDNRTLKIHLEKLKQYGYVNYEDIKLGKSNFLDIEIILKGNFLRLSTHLIKASNELMESEHKSLREKGLVYISYLEHRYNPDFKIGYACPSVREIQDIVKLEHGLYRRMCDIYHENYIVEYVSGYYYTDENGDTKRYRNRYIVNNVSYRDNDNEQKGRERYGEHKKSKSIKSLFEIDEERISERSRNESKPSEDLW